MALPDLPLDLDPNLIRDSLAFLSSGELCPLHPPRLTLHLPSNPPGDQSDAHATKHESHSHTKRHTVTWRKSTPEQLGPNGPPDLSITVDEADREGRARGSARGLRAPRPHHWIPCSCHSVAYQCCGVDPAVVGVDDEHGVASENDDKEGQRVQRSWQAPIVGEYACHGDDADSCGCDGDVEDLSCCDVSGSRERFHVSDEISHANCEQIDEGGMSTHVNPKLAITVDW